MPMDWVDQRQYRIVLPATCEVRRSPQGFTNLLVRQLMDGRIEIDPHVTGACTVTVEPGAGRQLVKAVLRWLGRTGRSVHHGGIVVVFELQQVVGGIPEDERLVSFGLAFEAAKRVEEKRQIVFPGPGE